MMLTIFAIHQEQSTVCWSAANSVPYTTHLSTALYNVPRALGFSCYFKSKLSNNLVYHLGRRPSAWKSTSLNSLNKTETS